MRKIFKEYFPSPKFSYNLIQNPFLEAEDIFELILKDTGHLTDISIDCTLKVYKSKKKCLVSFFKPLMSVLNYVIKVKISRSMYLHMRL
jgi:hypothetical protein